MKLLNLSQFVTFFFVLSSQNGVSVAQMSFVWVWVWVRRQAYRTGLCGVITHLGVSNENNLRSDPAEGTGWPGRIIMITRFPSGKWLWEWRKNETKSIQRETNATTREIEE